MTMAAAKLLIVEDDAPVRNLLVRFFRQKQYQVETAEDGQSALERFAQFKPHLVILDINLPDVLGYALCEQMHCHAPVLVLMLSSRNTVEDKREGFLKGADDYLTKPFDLEELDLRVQALLKRQQNMTAPFETILCFDRLTINSFRREVKLDEHLVNLTALEFDLLYFLATHCDRVWQRSQLFEQVWQQPYNGDNRVIDVHIGQIRKKIEPNAAVPIYIQTVRGVGYRFNSPAVIVAPSV